jgi:hypothetical protein
MTDLISAVNLVVRSFKVLLTQVVCSDMSEKFTGNTGARKKHSIVRIPAARGARVEASPGGRTSMSTCDEFTKREMKSETSPRRGVTIQRPMSR